MPQLASIQSCTGCLACVDACPQNAINVIHADDGHMYVRVNQSLCVNCLRCQKVCKKIHDGSYADNSRRSIPFSAYSLNSFFYENATSGGVFPEIASWVIRQGGVVYGASYVDGTHVAHAEIRQESELKKLQGSKYIQSDMSGVFRKIQNVLDRCIMVLFSGTGCQVAAVLTYFDKHPHKNLLYTLDVVCGGVPSSLLIESFAKNASPPFLSIAFFRQKEKYAFAYNTQTGERVLCKRSLPLDGFKSSLTNRYSCYDCEFAGIHRKSDWTIGDLWGRENTKCKSLCICHNERAKQIFETLNLKREPLPDWNFAVWNPRLVNGKCAFGSRFERSHLAWFFKHCSYKTLCKIYAADVKKRDVIGVLYKIYRLIRFNMYFNASKNVVKRIIK